MPHYPLSITEFSYTDHYLSTIAEPVDKVPAPICSCIVHTPSSDGFGMHGSGMFIIKPPWTLHQTPEEIMPYLVRVLGQDAGAGFTLSGQGD
jgi:23S rRNA A2030 N6-methylase RlmJ